MREVTLEEALNSLVFENKKIYVEHHANGLEYTKELKWGKNVAMLSEIPVTVLVYGKWYIIE